MFCTFFISTPSCDPWQKIFKGYFSADQTLLNAVGTATKSTSNIKLWPTRLRTRRVYWEALGGGRRGCKTCSCWFKILLNNCLSAVERRVAKSSVSLSQKPDRLLLLRNACSFCRYSVREAYPRAGRIQQLRENDRSIDIVVVEGTILQPMCT